MGPWLFPHAVHRVRDGTLMSSSTFVLVHALVQQLVGQDKLIKPIDAGLVFFLNKASKHQARAATDNFLACRLEPLAYALLLLLLLLEFRPRSRQSPCPSEGALPVRNCSVSMPSDRRLMLKCVKESMVLQVNNLHMRNGEISPIPCFSAHFAADALQCGDDVFVQNMVMWSEAFC